jgi:hypothetical protein
MSIKSKNLLQGSMEPKLKKLLYLMVGTTMFFSLIGVMCEYNMCFGLVSQAVGKSIYLVSSFYCIVFLVLALIHKHWFYTKILNASVACVTICFIISEFSFFTTGISFVFTTVFMCIVHLIEYKSSKIIQINGGSIIVKHTKETKN